MGRHFACPNIVQLVLRARIAAKISAAEPLSASAAGAAAGAAAGSCHLVSEAAGTMTFDSATNPTWAQDASNDVDAYWGIIYNYTDAGKDCLAYIELGGPVDMTAGDLTITWNASGILTIA